MFVISAGRSTIRLTSFKRLVETFRRFSIFKTKNFTTISCKRCGYTELYRGETSDGWNILDFLMGGG